ANRVIQGLALTRAEELAAEPVAVAALGRSAAAAAEPAPGGTADFLRRWTDLGRRAEVVDCDEIVGTGQGEGPGERSEQPPGGPAGPAGRREVKAMLFADVKGFSRLAEEQTPAFFGHFLAAVDGLLKEAPAGPTFGNTWGDGLYLVFDEPADCAAFGTQLRDRVGRTDFPALGLPADLAVRVGTHAGPVFRGPDPVIGRENYFGSHVTRAARIEPVTTPGCVYASEQMAALLAVDAAAGFRCGYVGEEHLAKGYDRCPLYVVEHAADG
ncbi:MAG TPA: adenylate/guanylate cyclase domain-containing protein, partial [Planctomycetaceae bacterium]